MMLTFEPTDKINQILCHHFKDNEKQYLGNEIKFQVEIWYLKIIFRLILIVVRKFQSTDKKDQICSHHHLKT